MRGRRAGQFSGRRAFSVAALSLLLLGASASPAAADHSWGDPAYHWARTVNPFTLQLDNNLTTPEWQAIGTRMSADWSASSVMDTPLGAPQTDNKRCKASSGRVEVCNGKYGFNGWLGVAQIWLSGSHIVHSTAKVNDSYFNTSTYNAPVKKQHVLCQEVGHTFGLGHQDESGADLNTCMDYAEALDNPSPDAHDYQQLEAIYSHLDGTTTVSSSSSSSSRGGLRRVRDNLWVEDLGNGNKRFVWVHWTDRGRHYTPPAGV